MWAFTLLFVPCFFVITYGDQAVCGQFNNICDPKIDAMHQPELSRIWNNIVNQDKIVNAPSTGLKSEDSVAREDPLPQILNSTTKNHFSQGLTYSSESRGPRHHSSGSNTDMMTRIFNELFLHRRSDDFSSDLKKKSREGIIDKLSHYTLETTSQEFFAKDSSGNVIQGVNIIGVIPGKNRNKPGDEILLIGAHYDTDANSPGVDDNGSGVVSMLEVARLLSPHMGSMTKTVMLVAFDLEEKGILGSLAFVNNYLIPNELVAKRARFSGAYILEMVLNYDNTSSSQILPLDVVMAVPESGIWLQLNGNRGDFVSLWARKVLDWELNHAFHEAWNKYNAISIAKNATNGDIKLYTFDPPIPRDPLLLSTVRFRAFFNSDHASFWTHKSTDYSEYLSAVLITDMGPWRGNLRACYHEFCDDKRMITPENLEFLKRITDSVAEAVVKLAA